MSSIQIPGDSCSYWDIRLTISSYLEIFGRFPSADASRRTVSTASAPSAIQLASMMALTATDSATRPTTPSSRGRSPPRMRKIGIVQDSIPTVLPIKKEEDDRKGMRAVLTALVTSDERRRSRQTVKFPLECQPQPFNTQTTLFHEAGAEGVYMIRTKRDFDELKASPLFSDAVPTNTTSQDVGDSGVFGATALVDGAEQGSTDAEEGVSRQV
ncbi:unnamed protein product [Bursaphelenchus xylophilus]|uniref:(pine wood nematode) hypothetical protein n=1 Tax=Bursaphelenchus xylophilus TaxID=6326 RepID=A0A1I7SS13_BURXY|nr:unnamed protein product [Bursaphelenchus xylophilus]CAG9105812.1 unnamed protein product [Bursaphelenchus xylophilus]